MEQVIVAKIISYEFYKEDETYDLEVEHQDHQYYLNNGLLTSNSHAVSYAITSYQTAKLLTYYPDEWITSALDYAAMEKGKANGQEDPKSVTLAEARQLGYDISKPDINKSELGYIIDPDKEKKIIPGMGSIKYVGKSAYWEIKNNRPYKTLADLFIDKSNNNKWRHSKFNKRALSSLIKLEAFDSLNLVGPNKLFKNYKDMHDVLIDNYDKLKRVSAKKKNNDVMLEISALLAGHIENGNNNNKEDWTREEKIDFQSSLQGSVDFSLIVPKEKQDKLNRLKIKCIDQFEFDEVEQDPKYKQDCWGIVKRAIIKTTKTGKPFLSMKLGSESGKEFTVMIFNWKGGIGNLADNVIAVAPFQYDPKFGTFKCWPNDLFVL